MLITSTEAMILIILSLVLSLVAALIARYPFAAASLSFIISLKSATGRISIVQLHAWML